jgi:hypothetical protein
MEIRRPGRELNPYPLIPTVSQSPLYFLSNAGSGVFR